jgi:hypothetical protein
MRDTFEKAAVAVASLVILPIIGESVVLFIQREDYDYARAISVALVLAGLAGLLFLIARIKSVRPRVVALSGVIIVGAGLFGFGLFLTLSGEVARTVAADTVYSLMITSGALMVGAGIFLIDEQRRTALKETAVRAAAEHERTSMEARQSSELAATEERYMAELAALRTELTKAREARARMEDSLSADPTSVAPPHEVNLINVTGGQARLAKYDSYTRAHDALVGIVQELLDPLDLHYVAYFIDGECVFYLDIFDDRKLGRFFSGRGTAESRRKGYESYGRFLNVLMTNLNAKFKKIDSGLLLRVVLDVEKGALYYYHVEEDKFVIGVTMDQAKVHEADRKMVTVVDEIRVSLGHRPIADLNR